MRDAIAGGSLLKQCVKDIRFLLQEDAAIEEDMEPAVLHLWDDKKGQVPNAVSYGKKETGKNGEEEDAATELEDEALEDGYGTILVDET